MASNGISAGWAGTSAYMPLGANALKGGRGSQHFHLLIRVGNKFFFFVHLKQLSFLETVAKAAQQVYHFYEQAPRGATLVPCSLPSPRGAALMPRPALLPVRCCEKDLLWRKRCCCLGNDQIREGTTHICLTGRERAQKESSLIPPRLKRKDGKLVLSDW